MHNFWSNFKNKNQKLPLKISILIKTHNKPWNGFYGFQTIFLKYLKDILSNVKNIKNEKKIDIPKNTPKDLPTNDFNYFTKITNKTCPYDSCLSLFIFDTW